MKTKEAMTEKTLKRIANQLAEWTYSILLAQTNVDRVQAKRAAINAANKAALSLAQDLEVDIDA